MITFCTSNWLTPLVSSFDLAPPSSPYETLLNVFEGPRFVKTKRPRDISPGLQFSGQHLIFFTADLRSSHVIEDEKKRSRENPLTSGCPVSLLYIRCMDFVYNKLNKIVKPFLTECLSTNYYCTDYILNQPQSPVETGVTPIKNRTVCYRKTHRQMGGSDFKR